MRLTNRFDDLDIALGRTGDFGWFFREEAVNINMEFRHIAP